MRKRSGFTMIEMLVVIGVILILAGMLFFGGRAIFGKSREQATRTTLGNLSNMLAELDAKTRAGGSGQDSLSGAYLNAPLNNPLNAPGNVSKDGGNPEVPQVRATIGIMSALRAMPLARSALEQLPADQIVTLADDASTPAFNESTVPLLADGWGNPIIFVPGRVIDATGAVIGAGGLSGVNRGTVVNDTVVSRDARPFFASAGEDGNFQKGDDNLYSFEN